MVRLHVAVVLDKSMAMPFRCSDLIVLSAHVPDSAERNVPARLTRSLLMILPIVSEQARIMLSKDDISTLLTKMMPLMSIRECAASDVNSEKQVLRPCGHVRSELRCSSSEDNRRLDI